MPDSSLAQQLTTNQWLMITGTTAVTGLTIAWRCWLARRRYRNRALQVLGYVKPTGPALPNGMRYAGVITVAILTILVLTPAVPGAGDVEQTAVEGTTASPEFTPAVVVVELHTDRATIILQGITVEIRLAPSQPTPVATGVGSRPGDNVAEPTVTATPPASVLPEGME